MAFENITNRTVKNETIMRGSRGGGGGGRGPGPPLENHKNIGFLSPDPLKNHKATKPAFNVGPSSARQRNAFLMAFRWRADGGPLKNSCFSKKNPSKLGSPLTKLSFWIRA